MLTVEKNDLDITAIHPKKGARFSPNLYRWLTQKHKDHRAYMSRVYRDSNGALWIGMFDEPFIIGSRLNMVLCYGVKESSGAYVMRNMGLQEVLGFWDRYMQVGRCAIDEAHSMYFVGDDSRWKVQGETRSCLWCGNCTQKLKQWEETVNKSAWENVNG